MLLLFISFHKRNISQKEKRQENENKKKYIEQR